MPTSPEAPNGSKFITRTPLAFLLAAVDCCDNGSDLKISCRVDFSTKIGSKSGTNHQMLPLYGWSHPVNSLEFWRPRSGFEAKLTSWGRGTTSSPISRRVPKKSRIGRQKRRLDRPGHAVWRPSTQSRLINTAWGALARSATFSPHPWIT